MRKTTAAIAIILLLLVTIVSFAFMAVKAEPRTITVPDDYPTIQAAITNANAGDTVFVRAGTYFQNDLDSIIINKPLSLIGENPTNTIIDQQSAPHHPTIQVNAANVTISGFTIKNYEVAIVIPYGGGSVENCSIINNKILNGDNGIWVADATNFTIKNNVISGNRQWGIFLYPRAVNGTITENTLSGNGWRQVPEGDGGIGLYGANNTVITKNTLSFGYEGLDIQFSDATYVYGNNITDNQEAGLIFGQYCNNAIVFGNNIERNVIGIRLIRFTPCGTNSIYHVEKGNMVYANNLVGNSIQVQVHSYEHTGENNSIDIISWDNGYVGNYWSDYRSKYPNASEADSWGIGDTPYVIDTDNMDRYPLLESISTGPPKISILSPLAQTYNETSVPLVFTLGKLVNWTGYSLDGKEKMTVIGNVTLSGLASGLHNVTVYAEDLLGRTGVSDTVWFNVAEPFPVVPVVVVSVMVAVVIVGLFFYFKKRKH
ncbi:MAG: right-handed parallel beta-helix repeat-containing protein [Candidatus Bathyarchaeota archaeon]|nr:right-handed parallel beta-helix repeat-containing protein [Candidatus Bathyarchaeota archaeon]